MMCTFVLVFCLCLNCGSYYLCWNTFYHVLVKIRFQTKISQVYFCFWYKFYTRITVTKSKKKKKKKKEKKNSGRDILKGFWCRVSQEEAYAWRAHASKGLSVSKQTDGTVPHGFFLQKKMENSFFATSLRSFKQRLTATMSLRECHRTLNVDTRKETNNNKLKFWTQNHINVRHLYQRPLCGPVFPDYFWRFQFLGTSNLDKTDFVSN